MQNVGGCNGELMCCSCAVLAAKPPEQHTTVNVEGRMRTQVRASLRNDWLCSVCLLRSSKQTLHSQRLGLRLRHNRTQVRAR
jgi:hypothetical protein